MNEIN
jgi:26S proteasome regulatory subunit N7